MNNNDLVVKHRIPSRPLRIAGQGGEPPVNNIPERLGSQGSITGYDCNYFKSIACCIWVRNSNRQGGKWTGQAARLHGKPGRVRTASNTAEFLTPPSQRRHTPRFVFSRGSLFSDQRQRARTGGKGPSGSGANRLPPHPAKMRGFRASPRGRRHAAGAPRPGTCNLALPAVFHLPRRRPDLLTAPTRNGA